MNARRASTTGAARKYRQRGHDDAPGFALAIGLKSDYERDPRAKKEVIDPAGDAHSVKSGRKKRQVFLYSRDRFLNDDGFQALNGIGSLPVHCIDAFPPRYSDCATIAGSAVQREPLSGSVSGSPEEQAARLEAGNAVLRERVARLVERITALERRSGLNSRNSGKPALRAKRARRRTRSLRGKTGRKPGGRLRIPAVGRGA